MKLILIPIFNIGSILIYYKSFIDRTVIEDRRSIVYRTSIIEVRYHDP